MKSFLRKTAISWVKSDRILLRGYPIDELAGNISWAAAVYLALIGELPNPRVARLFDAILVSVVDHGPTPASTLAACTVASTGIAARQFRCRRHSRDREVARRSH